MDTSTRQFPDEISLKDLIAIFSSFLKYLLRRWALLIICAIIGSIVGVLYALHKKTVYTATCSFVLDESKASGLSQYAGLASIAGIDLGSNGGGVFAGDNIIALYTSRTMLAKTLLDTANFNGKSELLINRYVDAQQLRKHWSKKGLNNVQFNIPFEKFSRAEDSLLIDIITGINKKILLVSKPDKKLDIINVDVHSGDELFALNFNQKLVATVNDFYIRTKTKKSADNVAVLQKQVDSVRQVLNASIGGVASALDASPNANPALLSLRVPSQRRQVDVQASSSIYAELVKNLELAKISLRQETPLIQVIDGPLLPLPAEKLGKLKGLLLGGFVGLFVAVAYLSFARVWAFVTR